MQQLHVKVSLLTADSRALEASNAVRKETRVNSSDSRALSSRDSPKYVLGGLKIGALKDWPNEEAISPFEVLSATVPSQGWPCGIPNPPPKWPAGL